jgi:S1-C subfamily serine protease
VLDRRSAIVIESLLLAATRVSTLWNKQTLTGATGFFFERDKRLFLVTSRHVVLDEASHHRPDELSIELHVDATNLGNIIQWSMPLYNGDAPQWRQAVDSGGSVDIVAVEIDRPGLPEATLLSAYSPAHLVTEFDQIEVGNPVLIVGFPLGFHDTLHHLPVARQAAIASAFGIRFQGQGYFLTDARMHRGTSGAPVVARVTAERSGRGDLAWMLLGVHSARMDVSDRDAAQDDGLDLNCAWYADVLLTLTE